MSEHVLVNHGLGYKPLVMVVFNGHMLSAGETVQTAGVAGTRHVAVYVTTSAVILSAVGGSGQGALPAISITYRVLVFRRPVAVPGLRLFSGPNPIIVARGKLDSQRSILRLAGSGSTSYALSMGRTGDLNNGAVRFAVGGTIITEPGYGGPFTGSPYQAVGTT